MSEHIIVILPMPGAMWAGACLLSYVESSMALIG